MERSPAAFDLVVMIASLGGQQSISAVLSGLQDDFPVPVITFQHGRRRGGPEPLTPILQRRTSLPVRTGETADDPVQRGVTVIPRGYTARFDRHYRLTLLPAPHGGGGNTLLIGAADAAGPRLIGVILTGMLNDGTDGVRAVKRRGGRVLVEDPSTAKAAGMPSSAIATGCVDVALPNTRLAGALVELASAPGGARSVWAPATRHA